MADVPANPTMKCNQVNMITIVVMLYHYINAITCFYICFARSIYLISFIRFNVFPIQYQRLIHITYDEVWHCTFFLHIFLQENYILIINKSNCINRSFNISTTEYMDSKNILNSWSVHAVLSWRDVWSTLD